MSTDPLRLEFGRYTEWILEAAAATGVSDPIAIACRGTGDPGLFEDLAAGIGARPGMRVLDAGCGMGGPGTWLRRNRGCDVVGVDLMEESVRAGRTLFDDRSSIVASTSALPFPAATFDALWSVGVLEMVEDKSAALREAARVLRPGGRIALYSFTAAVSSLHDPPVTDHFVSPAAVGVLADAAGLEVVSARAALFSSAVPGQWAEARSAVAAEIRRRHGDDPDYEEVAGELARFARLRSDRSVAPWRFDLIKPGGHSNGAV